MSPPRAPLVLAAACALLLDRPLPAAPAADALPPGALARLGTPHFRHADAVNAVAVSPDGKKATRTPG